MSRMEINPKNELPQGISAEEAALYSRQLIDSLRRLALVQNHLKLAELLEAAESEAETLAAKPAKKRHSS